MKKYIRKLKRKAMRKKSAFEDKIITYIQPFKQMPSESATGQKNTDRINAHELFSHYTAEIIKEDIVFTR